MAFLIDTNILIHARDGHEAVLDRLAAHDGSVVASALSLAELQAGLHRFPDLAALRRARLAVLLDAIDILPFDDRAALRYGDVIAQCGWARARSLDRMIAAHALTIEAVLVTNNIADFGDIPGLAIQDWTRPISA